MTTESSESSASKPTGAAAVVSSGSSTYAVAMLTAIFALNFLDRQIVTILAGPIKAEMGLTDTQLGLISGLAFALFYAALGLPIAALAERFNRVWIISASVVLWSAMTSLCGLATNFTQLFLARVGVGIGEAGCVPASHALISATVSPARRATALAIFSLGIPLGTLLGLAVGGWIAQVYGWRFAFLVVGLPGVLLGTLAMLTLRDPRHGPGRIAITPTRPAPTGTSIRRLLDKPTYVYAVGGGTFASMAAFGITAFLGLYVQGRYGLTLGQAGLLLGLVIGIAGGIGSAAGGWLVDRLGGGTSHVLVPAAAMIVTGPCLAAALLTSNPVASLALFAIGTLASTAWYGPTFATFQGVSTVSSRAIAVAVFTLVANLIGLGLGPLAVGIMSDAFAGQMPGPGSAVAGLTAALTAATMLYGLAALCYWRAARTLNSDWEAELTP